MERNEAFSTCFGKSVLNICLIKAQNSISPCNNGGTIYQKNLYYSSGRELPFIGLLLALSLIYDMN